MNPRRLVPPSLMMLLCAVLIVAATAKPSSPTAYHFTLDGASIMPEITPVFGEVGSPAPGDVVKIGDFLMVLGDAGDHVFRSDGEDRLLGRFPGMDTEACVAVQVRQTLKDGDEWISIDPLSPMTAGEKASLRGLRINDHPANLDTALAGVRWEHTALVVNYGIAKEGMEVLPPLPAGLRYLDFDLTIMPSLRDVRTLAPLRKLVYLSLDHRVELDLSLLTCGPELRFFDIGGAQLTNLDAISRWTALRDLRLNSCDALTDLEFLKKLTELRRLHLAWTRNLKEIGPVAHLTQLTHLELIASQVRDISPVAALSSLTTLGIAYTPVTDLSPIGRLPSLQSVRANGSAVDTLPDRPALPRLARITLLQTPVSADKVAAFQKAIPTCRIHHTLEGTLLTELAGADRMRARTGGTCHRRIEQETSLFEIKGPEQVRTILESIKLVEPDGVGVCMCCGNPSFEIYRGEELMTTLALHHGRSLRWEDGWWPGDIELTEVSAAYLCKLLAKHDYGYPLAQHQERIRLKMAFERHRAACLELITAEQFNGWQEASRQGDEGDLNAIVRKAMPDAEKRTATVYALYGALPEAPWHTSQQFDRVTRDLLKTTDPHALKTILARDDCPAQILQGVARRTFNAWNDAIAGSLPTPLFDKLANWALRHPSEYNRRQTVDNLAAMNTERANHLIVRFLHESPQPRQADAPGETAPGEKPYAYSDPNEIDLDPFAPKPAEPAVHTPNPYVVPDSASEPVAAAILLAQHGYHDALTEIRKLAAGTKGDERQILEEAASHLANPAKE